MPVNEDIPAIRSKLADARSKLLESIANLSRPAMLHPFGDGGWSIKDILAHLVMAESFNVKFARLMVEKDAPLQLQEFAHEFPDFPGEFELDKFNAWMTERWRAQSLEEVLTALQQTRAETLTWLDTLSSEQLDRRGEHAVWSTQSVRGMLRILVIHDKLHRGDIEKRK